jgi:hypothetical protein
MIDRTDLDLRYAAHAARMARIDREGWQRSAPTRSPARGTRPAVTPMARIGRMVNWFLAATKETMRADQRSA